LLLSTVVLPFLPLDPERISSCRRWYHEVNKISLVRSLLDVAISQSYVDRPIMYNSWTNKDLSSSEHIQVQGCKDQRKCASESLGVVLG
jgi:hypothetical protein